MERVFGHCPRCSYRILISEGYSFMEMRSKCPSCGALIDIQVEKSSVVPSIFIIKLIEKRE